jgi:hypothetical protein
MKAEEEKYYTPESGEFKDGFEYEYLEGNNRWIEDSVLSVFDPTTMELIQDSFNQGELRVKHLDKSDIESLDWEQDKSFEEFTESKKINVYNKALKFRGNDSRLMLIHNTVSNWVLLSWANPKDASYVVEVRHEKLSTAPTINLQTNNTIFAGTIKNKSEFKQVLKMIGI